MRKTFFIIDDVLEKEEFIEYQHRLQNISVYSTFETSEKQKLYVTEPPFGLKEKLVSVLEEVHNKSICMSLCIVRKSTHYLDKDWNIHSDAYVTNEPKPTHSAVYYITENNNELNGTALWKHKDHKHYIDDSLSLDEIKEFTDTNYNEIDNWELSSVIGGVENRLFIHPVECFHSKFPKQAWGSTQANGRLVVSMLYSFR